MLENWSRGRGNDAGVPGRPQRKYTALECIYAPNLPHTVALESLIAIYGIFGDFSIFASRKIVLNRFPDKKYHLFKY